MSNQCPGNKKLASDKLTHTRYILELWLTFKREKYWIFMKWNIVWLFGRYSLDLIPQF